MRFNLLKMLRKWQQKVKLVAPVKYITILLILLLILPTLSP